MCADIVPATSLLLFADEISLILYNTDSFCTTISDIGYPQCGQIFALSDTLPSHSGQIINAILYLHCFLNNYNIFTNNQQCFICLSSFKAYSKKIFEVFKFDGLREGFGTLGDLSKKFFSSFAGSATLGIATFFAMKKAIEALSDAYNLSYDSAMKNTQANVDSFNTTKTEIESLNSQAEEYKNTLSSMGEKYDVDLSGLGSIDEMITKLKQSGKLELTDEAEIAKIDSENAALERQLAIKEKLANSQQKQAASDAKDALGLGEQSVAQQVAQDVPGGKRTYQGTVNNVNIVDAVTEDVAAIQEYENAIEKAEKAMKDLDPDSKAWKEQEENINSYNEAIEKLTEDLNTKETDLSTLLSAFSVDGEGLVALDGFEKEFEAVKDAIENLNNINLSPAEQKLAKIESFFDGSVGKNFIKEYLLEAVESGRSASSALNELGFSLEDIGITGENNVKIFNDYFDGLVSSAEEAESALNSVAGTTDSVKAAFESENSGQTWADMTDYLKQAEELRKAGKIGTDEFQNMAQWISPSKIDPDAKNKDGSRKYATDAEAYAAAWDKAYKKVKRWFDTDNPVDSMWNFVDDLEAAEVKFEKNLVDVDGNKITTQFKTTAEAAEALGVNVQVVDTLLRNLEDYGFEFDDVLFSGEGLMEYQSALEGIKQLYDSMDSGSNKDRLGNLIEGWDEDYAKCEEDLSNLTEDKIIHIQFEYDLATIQQQIDQLLSQQKGEGGKNAETNSEILAGNESYISKAKEGLGLDLEGVEIPAELKVADEEIDSLYKDLRNAEYGSDEFLEIQAEIQNKQELEKELLELFSEQHPEINAESNVEDVEKAWNDFFSGTQHLTIDATLKKDEVESQLNQLAKGSSITFTANVDGVERDVKAVKNKDGEIVYYSFLDDGSQQIIDAKADKTGTLTFTSQDETKEGVNSAEKNIGSLPEKASTNLYANDKTLAGVSSAYKRAQAFADTTFTAKLAVSSSGVHDLNGTAHLSGTVGDYSIPKLSGRALANGTLQNTDWLKRHWITDKGAYALTGEVGQELVVDAQSGEWFTVGDRGSEFSYIPSGSVVFNAQQTKDLLSKGHINSRGKSLLSGTAYGTGTLPSRGTSSSKTSSSGTSSSKTTTVKTSNKTTKSVNKALDAISQWFDWIEIRLDRLARNSENAEKAIDRAVGLANVLSATNDAITAIAKEQEAAEKGAARYLKAAQQVAKNTGLSADLQKKVQNGTIDITKYSETTQKKIEEYQNW